MLYATRRCECVKPIAKEICKLLLLLLLLLILLLWLLIIIIKMFDVKNKFDCVFVRECFYQAGCQAGQQSHTKHVGDVEHCDCYASFRRMLCVSLVKLMVPDRSL